MNTIELQQTLPVVFADKDYVVSDVWHKQIAFRKGQICLVEAASGTGKSSLCSFVYGYRKDYQGIISFDGENVGKFTVDRWVNIRKKRIEYAFSGVALVSGVDGRRKCNLEKWVDKVCQPKADGGVV